MTTSLTSDLELGNSFSQATFGSGDMLPAGTYQVIESRSSNALWQTFELGVDGEIVDYATTIRRGRKR